MEHMQMLWYAEAGGTQPNHVRKRERECVCVVMVVGRAVVLGPLQTQIQLPRHGLDTAFLLWRWKKGIQNEANVPVICLG